MQWRQQIATDTVIFTPLTPLRLGYTITIADHVQQMPTVWTFTTTPYRLFFPLTIKQP
nr:hypothetical protein [Ardenticatena sp.]